MLQSRTIHRGGVESDSKTARSQFIKVGSLVRYRPEELEAWLAALPTGGTSAAVRRQASMSAVRSGSTTLMVYRRSKVWWYKFTWNGEQIRESSKHTNKRVVEQIESARKTEPAKGEVGIRDREVVPTLTEFADHDFSPLVEARFENKPNTLGYYRNGIRSLKAFPPLADRKLDVITADRIAGFVAKLREAGLSVASINRQLEVMRRILRLALEWGDIDRALPRVETVPGENHRDRVLSPDEETRDLQAATTVGNEIEAAYERALSGIRATLRGKEPIKPRDPFQLRDVTTLLIDCGLRPDECFRLRWEHIREGAVHVPFGKTARRTIPLTSRATAFLDMRRAVAKTEWLFPPRQRNRGT